MGSSYGPPSNAPFYHTQDFIVKPRKYPDEKPAVVVEPSKDFWEKSEREAYKLDNDPYGPK